VRERKLPLRLDDMLVGDTGEDVVAARELGVVAVCVSNGFREAAYLATYEPDCIYPNLLAFAEARFP
jgi:phosphoglycolate phosphatase-like HAD superfamily hydrolase